MAKEEAGGMLWVGGLLGVLFCPLRPRPLPPADPVVAGMVML